MSCIHNTPCRWGQGAALVPHSLLYMNGLWCNAPSWTARIKNVFFTAESKIKMMLKWGTIFHHAQVWSFHLLSQQIIIIIIIMTFKNDKIHESVKNTLLSLRQMCNEGGKTPKPLVKKPLFISLKSEVAVIPCLL